MLEDPTRRRGHLRRPDATRREPNARAYLDSLGKIAPYTVVPGNHDIRWLGAVARNLGLAGLFREQAHKFKYSRYTRHISEELSPSLEVPGVVIAGVNTAHGITRVRSPAACGTSAL